MASFSSSAAAADNISDTDQNEDGLISQMQSMHLIEAGADKDVKAILLRQQQRLLLLRHASKCPYDQGRCPITLHCASMKILWKHIMSCKDQHCSTSHCVSSRYVLSHYSKCREEKCPVCAPVKDAIRRKYEQSQR